jgi:hypothetical protein
MITNKLNILENEFRNVDDFHNHCHFKLFKEIKLKLGHTCH